MLQGVWRGCHEPRKCRAEVVCNKSPYAVTTSCKVVGIRTFPRWMPPVKSEWRCQFRVRVRVRNRVRKLLPERDYVMFGYFLYCKSVCLSSVISVTCALLSRLNFSENFYALLYLTIRWPPCKIFTQIVPGEPLRRRLNARGAAKYSDFGPVEGYISETVQDTASGKINDW